MQAILEELKGSMGGIVGSFVIGERGKVLAQDVPKSMSGELGKVSMTLHHQQTLFFSYPLPTYYL